MPPPKKKKPRRLGKFKGPDKRAETIPEEAQTSDLWDKNNCLKYVQRTKGKCAHLPLIKHAKGNQENNVWKKWDHCKKEPNTHSVAEKYNAYNEKFTRIQ